MNRETANATAACPLPASDDRVGWFFWYAGAGAVALGIVGVAVGGLWGMARLIFDVWQS